MDLSIRKLIEGQILVCVHASDAIRQALDTMIENNYSQLPVVDKNGVLLGVVSEQTIVRSLYHWDGKGEILDRTVDHCMVDATTVSPEDSFFAVLDDLERSSDVLVVEGDKSTGKIPTGIITGYDINLFFRAFSEDLVMVRQIEETLREQAKIAFHTSNQMQAALYKALGAKDKENLPGVPKKEYDELDFSGQIALITHEKNWNAFKEIFEPKEVFTTLMVKAGSYRNRLAHYREDLTPVERDALKNAANWIDACLRRTQPVEITTIDKYDAGNTDLTLQDQASTTLSDERENVIQQTAPINEVVSIEALQQARGRKFMKYKRLTEWLRNQDDSKDDIRVSFSDIEGLVDTELPASAYKYRAYWTNWHDPDSNSQVWLSAGWSVANVDLSGQTVTFHRTDPNAQQAQAQ